MKNYKILGSPCFTILFFLFSIGSTKITFASGIDWGKSIMMIEFTEENAYTPPFSCFGYTATRTENPNGPTIGCGNPYAGSYDHCVWEYLSVLGFDDETPSPSIENCFQQAGNYRALVYLVDFAENVEGPDVSSFIIKPGPPDPNISEFETESRCTDLSLTANGQDSCYITLKVRDAFGNPVTQLKNQTGTLFSDSDFANDANLGDYNFRTGTRINNIPIPSITETPLSFSIGNTDEVLATLNVTSWVPSLSKIGEYLATNEPFNYGFHLTLPSVDENGNLDPSQTVVFQYDQYVSSLGFKPWVTLLPELMVNPAVFILDTAIPLKLVRNVLFPLSGGPNDLVSIFLKYHNLNTGLYFSGNDVSFDTGTQTAQIDSSQQEKTIHPILNAVEAGITILGSVAFSTEISYQISDNGSKTIRYPSGATGNGIPNSSGADNYNTQALYTGLLGVSIEGKVMGDKDKRLVQDFQGTRLGNIAGETDVRETIFENAHRISRNLAPQAQTGNNVIHFNPSWFTNSPVSVIENADVMMENSGNPLELPTGKNTLVIKNGNLIVENDVIYANTTDSFGLILINDRVETEPTTGNIFIKDDVKKFAGTIFAEGALMTIPHDLIITNDGDVSIDDASNGHVFENATQLLFEGTILTHNTLGGGYLTQNDVSYFTPWGNTPGITEVDRLKAEKYDLNFLRSYQPIFVAGVQTNTDKCVTDPATSTCTTNVSAMIIKNDGKAAQLPPPGFTNLDFIGR